MGKIDKNFFDFSKIAKVKWAELNNLAQKKYGISFNLENDDSIEQKNVTIDTPDNAFETASGEVVDDKSSFSCELCQAGGDWEVPVMYFCCQIKKGRNLMSDEMFVLIPNVSQGNKYLIKDGGKFTTPNNNDFEGNVEFDNKELWKSLSEMLVDLDKERKIEIKKVSSILVARIVDRICERV